MAKRLYKYNARTVVRENGEEEVYIRSIMASNWTEALGKALDIVADRTERDGNEWRLTHLEIA